MSPHVISAEANVRAANVKPQSGGHSQNYMPPEAKDTLDKAAKAQAVATAASAVPTVK